MTPREQYDIAAEVLTKFRMTFDPHAIVAGGAARDWYLGTPAQDIDVFYNPGRYRASVSNWLLERYGESLVLGEDLPQEYSSPYINKVVEITIKGLKFQFIEVKDSTFSILETFPCNLSKAWIIPRLSLPEESPIRGLIRTSPEFNDGIINKELTFRKSTPLKYAKKMFSRFNDYTLRCIEDRDEAETKRYREHQEPTPVTTSPDVPPVW